MGAPGNSGNGAPGSADYVTLYLAARILKAAGFDAESAARILKEVYGVEVEPARVEWWLNIIPSEVKRRKVASVLVSLSKDKLPALRYSVGAALGDADASGRLEVADWEFAQAYAAAIATLTGDPDVKVRKTREGYYRVECRLVGFIARSPLWKTVAYLDRLDERKYFLSGLLDAEGSLIPIVDRKRKNLRVRVQFANANHELAAYVMEAFKELGLKPRTRVIEPGEEHTKKDGEVVRRKKTLYKVYADLTPTDAALTKLVLNCWRKKLLLDFLESIKKLPPRQRYYKFRRCWRKIGNKWWPTGLVFGEQHRRKTYVVECPRCQRTGVFELLREADGEARVRIHHEDGVCEFTVAGRGEGVLARCKCGELGYVYVTTQSSAPWRPRKYVYVAMEHRHTGRKKKTCTLAFLRLANVNAEPLQPPPAHQPQAENWATLRKPATSGAESWARLAQRITAEPPLPHGTHRANESLVLFPFQNLKKFSINRKIIQRKS